MTPLACANAYGRNLVVVVRVLYTNTHTVLACKQRSKSAQMLHFMLYDFSSSWQ